MMKKKTRTSIIRMMMVIVKISIVMSDTSECQSSDPERFSDLVERRPIAFPCVRLFHRDGFGRAAGRERG